MSTQSTTTTMTTAATVAMAAWDAWDEKVAYNNHGHEPADAALLDL